MNRKSSKTKTWPLSKAGAQLDHIIDRAVSHGPQTVTRYGKPTVMVLSVPDYVRHFGRPPGH